MIQEKELRSYRRLLRTFLNNSRRELKILSDYAPQSKNQEDILLHNRKLLAGLINSAEQTLRLVDLFLGDGIPYEGTPEARLFQTMHIANAMTANTGTFLHRIADLNNLTEQDVEWATARKEVFDIIKHLLGRGDQQTTVEDILKRGTLPAAWKAERRTESVADVERRFGLPPGSVRNVIYVDGNGQLSPGESIDASGTLIHDLVKRMPKPKAPPATRAQRLEELIGVVKSKNQQTAKRPADYDIDAILTEVAEDMAALPYDPSNQEIHNAIVAKIDSVPGLSELLDSDEWGVQVVRKRR